MNETLIAVVPLVYLAVMAIPLLITDYKEHRLPNKTILPFIVLSFFAGLIASAVSGEWFRFGYAVIIAFTLGIIGIIANYAGLIGMGDVKLFFGVALTISWFSPLHFLITLLTSFGIAFLVVAVLVLRGKVVAGTSIPLGLFTIPTTLIFGTLAVIS